jgi:hypothetical protein
MKTTIGPLVDLVDESTLMIGLKGFDYAIAGCCLFYDLNFDLIERNRTIDFGFSFA